MTEIYCLDRGGETLPEEAAALLPPWRREIYDRLKNEKVRQESLWTGLLFAYAVERRGVPAGEAAALLPAGKPVLRDRRELHFSLSHSGRFILCAVGDAPVGADVQQMRDVRESMARRFCPGERTWLESLPPEERKAAFFRLWTRKEAWVKAVSDERMLSLSEQDVLDPPAGMFFRDYDLPEGYAAAACCLGEDLPALTPVAPGDLRSGIV